jgi:tetratricopeptide (TPR) repeat protein
MLGCLSAGPGTGAAGAATLTDKKPSAQSIKSLKFGPMPPVLHNRLNPKEVAAMRPILIMLALISLSLQSQFAAAQMYGQGGPMNGPTPIGNRGPAAHEESLPSNPSPEKPDKAAAKAYASGMKALQKAHELEDTIAQSTDPEKKAKAEDKLGDTYGAALDQFTEALRNKGDLYDAWNEVGYVHLRLGAYRESIDDYDHALKLKPDLPVATANRALACLMADRLDDAKSAYMELFFHERPLADQLMVHMQDWVQQHRAQANGVRAADIEAFDKWVTERNGIAKTAAAGS